MKTNCRLIILFNYFWVLNFWIENFKLTTQVAIRERIKKKIKLDKVENCIRKKYSIHIKSDSENKSNF